LHRARALDVSALRVLEVVHSERKGCRAMVIDDDGGMVEVWLWWYQAVDGELVICREVADDAPDPNGVATLSFGNGQRRGVIDRVPRDVMALYLHAQLLESGRFS
jgi:hypothetical protein